MKNWLVGLLVVFLTNLGLATSVEAASSASDGKTIVPERSKPKASSLRALKTEESRSSAFETNSSTPTYLGDLRPLFMGKCFRCHNNETRFLNNWLDYKTAFADRWELKRRLWDSWRGDYFKQPMPMANSPESEAITEDERRMIKDWVVHGAVLGVAPKESNPQSKSERIETGRRLFITICAACHQPTGQGIPDRFPPLAGSDFLNGNKERAIQVVLNGLQGEVVVNGRRFNNSMPVFPLSDGDIASALTYVYNSFGNCGKDVTSAEVKALRGQTGPVTANRGQSNPASSRDEKSPWE
jgi:mono/diheme cytochrome c family protein